MVCEKCGGMMIVRQEGSMQGMFCTDCDWSIVTTRIAEIELDRTLYVVAVIGADFRDHAHVKAVALIAGVNTLVARKILHESEPQVFQGSAVEVRRVQETLSSVGIRCKIFPDFPG